MCKAPGKQRNVFTAETRTSVLVRRGKDVLGATRGGTRLGYEERVCDCVPVKEPRRICITMRVVIVSYKTKNVRE